MKMTRAQQRAFVRDLSRNVAKGVLANSHKWPEHWDGHELRALLAEAFRQSNCGQCDDRSEYANRGRRRAFLKDCAVLQLPA